MDLSIRSHTSSTLSISILPDEILRIILSFLPSNAIADVSLVSKKFNSLTQEGLLWRAFCQQRYRFWNVQRNITQQWNAPIHENNWKEIYVDRRIKDEKVNQLMDEILSSQTDRIAKFHQIAGLGYEAKDQLLRHIDIHDDAADVLCRRLVSHHRGMAVREKG